MEDNPLQADQSAQAGVEIVTLSLSKGELLRCKRAVVVLAEIAKVSMGGKKAPLEMREDMLTLTQLLRRVEAGMVTAPTGAPAVRLLEPNFIAREKTAEVERLRKLVRDAYVEGFNEGTREHSTSRGGKPWCDSDARAVLNTETER